MSQRKTHIVSKMTGRTLCGRHSPQEYSEMPDTNVDILKSYIRLIRTDANKARMCKLCWYYVFA